MAKEQKSELPAGECCGKCRFMEKMQLSAQAKAQALGSPDPTVCRRWPPQAVPMTLNMGGGQMVNSMMGTFPPVDPAQWCGEYQDREVPAKFRTEGPAKP